MKKIFRVFILIILFSQLQLYASEISNCDLIQLKIKEIVGSKKHIKLTYEITNVSQKSLWICSKREANGSAYEVTLKNRLLVISKEMVMENEGEFTFMPYYSQYVLLLPSQRKTIEINLEKEFAKLFAQKNGRVENSLKSPLVENVIFNLGYYVEIPQNNESEFVKLTDDGFFAIGRKGNENTQNIVSLAINTKDRSLANSDLNFEKGNLQCHNDICFHVDCFSQDNDGLNMWYEIFNISDDILWVCTTSDELNDVDYDIYSDSKDLIIGKELIVNTTGIYAKKTMFPKYVKLLPNESIPNVISIDKTCFSNQNSCYNDDMDIPAIESFVFRQGYFNEIPQYVSYYADRFISVGWLSKNEENITSFEIKPNWFCSTCLDANDKAVICN